MTSMTSKRLDREDARIFCDMMNISRQILADAINHSSQEAKVGMLTIRYNSLSDAVTFTFSSND